MQYTTHYNLNLPEGTDIVNPLVQDNPNYSAIDAAMFANKQAVIGTASEVVSGTVHAITRSNTDSDYFKFTATGNWTAGDSMSVDGTTVSVFLSDGTTPATGAYVINTEVLALLNGSRVTLLISSNSSASEVDYNNTGSGLVATDVQDAIDELKTMVDARYVLTTNAIAIPSATINANDYASYTIDITAAGYTPIAVVGIRLSGTGSGRLNISSFYVSGNTAIINITNDVATNITFAGNIYILYYKN